ncbi:hypothetical protein [Gracilinema caldarium]|uniref:hypothetical protein n=1 Tax=Gracilinema caldarium TaxID=215591 RepID=UPI0026EEF74C|nr:hypothetical protein [Gracilinema caldarium]
MNHSGLLKKAEERLHEHANTTDTTTGISPEDRAEIISQIDKITRQNRRTFDSSAFAVKAQKHGLLFPLAVNIIVICATAFALYGLSQFFSQRTTEIQRSGTVLNSAEGKLIQEIKKEAEGQLAQKEKEIAEFQARLASLEKEQANLKASFQERLAQKEAEFKELLRKEVEQERERLLKQGLSEAAIQERLKKFEIERLAYYKQKLEEYQKQLEQERIAAEASYAKLRQEYSSNISALNAERQKIQEEARQREQQLRSSLEQKNQELASTAAQASASLEEAKKELARIDEQRRAAAAAEDQIAGLYQSIQTAFQNRRFDEGLRAINSFKSLLNDPAITSLPSIQKRRAGDLFALDVMGQLARLEVERSSIDTNVLLAQAEALAAIRSAVQEGRTALQNNNADEAAAAYQKALSRIPEITEAHNYFVNRTMSDREQSVKTALAALSRATSARISKDFNAAALAYGESLRALGLSPEESLQLTEGISALAVEQNRANLAAKDTAEAKNLIRKGKTELDQQNWNAAIRTYASLLKKHPNAEQTASALEGIETALINMTRDAERSNTETQQKVQELEAKIAQLTIDLEKSLAEVKSLQSGSSQTIPERDNKIAELERLLEEERQRSKAMANQAGTASAVASSEAGTGNTTGLEQDLTKLRTENEQLTQVAKEYDTLSQAYKTYQAEEDQLLTQTGAGSILAARSQLETFLTSPAVKKVFPTLRDRIARYEKAFVEAGQKESLYNAMTIADTAFKLKDETSRSRYFQDLKFRYKDDQAMLAFVDALQRGLR